jgi:hypothetical protein
MKSIIKKNNKVSLGGGLLLLAGGIALAVLTGGAAAIAGGAIMSLFGATLAGIAGSSMRGGSVGGGATSGEQPTVSGQVSGASASEAVLPSTGGATSTVDLIKEPIEGEDKITKVNVSGKEHELEVPATLMQAKEWKLEDKLPLVSDGPLIVTDEIIRAVNAPAPTAQI